LLTQFSWGQAPLGARRDNNRGLYVFALNFEGKTWSPETSGVTSILREHPVRYESSVKMQFAGTTLLRGLYYYAERFR
jgi:hypothetical protein